MTNLSRILPVLAFMIAVAACTVVGRLPTTLMPRGQMKTVEFILRWSG